jgi:hypothetical protein
MNLKTFRFLIIILISITILLLLFIAIRSFSSSSTNSPKCPIQQQQTPIVYQYKNESRDQRVIDDPLYPPLNREDRVNFNNVKTEVELQNFNVPLNDIGDSYHLVGYLTYNDNDAKDSGGNNWKLFGRMKNKNQGDFYIIPANNNYDIKIPLTQDIVISERLRDLYTIPNEMQFRSPMLNNGVYKFIELPKTDFSSARYL